MRLPLHHLPTGRQARGLLHANMPDKSHEQGNVGEPTLHGTLLNIIPQGVLSVHSASVFKPHANVYRIAEEVLGLRRSQVGFVTSNG